MAETFGQIFKRARIASGQTLRTFCRDHHFDPGNTSKIERGRMGPPESDDRLTEYAVALKLPPETPEWQEFFDVAAAERGKIPSDLLTDDELVRALPVLYRTLRGLPVDGDSLENLIEKIRRA
jgi:transcriptional regulator with XRE-family HTH domain